MRFVDTSAIRSRFDVRVPMRDGAELSVDVYLPPTPGAYPVLLTRTPYDNNRSARATRATGATTLPPTPADRFKKLAACGFAVVACDVRGRGDSDGTFTPFVAEAADGADTVEWARALPEGDGRVGVFGAGYAGFTALAAAAHPAVAAAVVWSPFGAGDSDGGDGDGPPGRGGAVRLGWLFWQHLVGGRSPQPVDVPPWHEIFRHRPLAEAHLALGRPAAPWPEWMSHPDPGDDYWAALDLDQTLADGAAATLFVSGWWDPGLAATLRHWRAARLSPAGRRHRLVVGPWDAAAVRHPRLDPGGVAWGPAAVVDPDEMLIDWCAARLRAGPRPGDDASPPDALPPDAAPVRVFRTGRNEWLDADDWPGAAGTRVLWLSSGGRANTRGGDGRLVPAPPGGQDPDRFGYDPDDPLPWQPGDGSFSRSGTGAFTLDTGFATARDDACVYTADPVTEPTVLRGRPRVTLWAETDAPDTDWVVGVEDVFPGAGRSVHLAHGIVRARTRPGFAPGRPVEYEIPLTDVEHELLPGHAVRLVVSSSLFPLYAANPGAADYFHGADATRADQTIHHGAGRPSRLDLPLG